MDTVNNFILLEPHIENNMSGCDDIGETLTGNTEGMNDISARRE